MMHRVPLTSKIGEVPESVDKFASWSGNYGYYQRSESAADMYKTDYVRNSTFNLDDLKNNKFICTKQLDFNKSKGTTDMAKPFYGEIVKKTTFVDHYANQRKVTNSIKDTVTLESFRFSFNKHISNELSPVDDLNEDVTIVKSKIGSFIREAVGTDLPDYVRDKFMQRCEMFIKEGTSLRGFPVVMFDLGTLSWKDFKHKVYRTVVESIEADGRYRRELPPLMTLMNKPRIVDRKLGSLGDMSSTYRENFNKEVALSFNNSSPKLNYVSPEGPEDAPTHLNKAGKILCAGTIKGTLQLPGYSGHIPANVRNARKYDHSHGAHPHPVQNNLRLTQRGMGCVLGYTGHVPHEINGDFRERMTSCDFRTSNGAAFSGSKSVSLL